MDELSLDYDFLIISPGIGYKNKQVEGYSVKLDKEKYTALLGW